MDENKVVEILGRRLRLAVIGGAPGSFIGGMHRMASRIDDRYEIVASVLSSNPEKAVKAGKALGIPDDRAYADVPTMLKTEKKREDGADVVAIMTPNDSHFTYAMAALELGYHVICDKPMTNTVEEAEALHNKVKETGLVFCLTHNYTGYPMVRQAKAMVQAGKIGDLRLLQVEYVQGGKADESKPDKTTGPRSWKFDPEKGGPSLVMGDIGTHAHNIIRYVTGQEVSQICAEAGAIVPGRIVDDFAGALLRMEKGARGSYWVTQAAAGVENSLKFRISGTKGTLEWHQEFPQRLTYRPIGAPVQSLTPNGPGTLPLAARSSRIAPGHPEGFPMGFANIYKDASEAIAAAISGTEADPLALTFPDSFDGLMGVRFVKAVVDSTREGSVWKEVVQS
ncbi:Gfo/Idh/MocA family protein [Spirochaeta isovalerica]|uniref:Putative dehydrogenase n=1 Tax=Spirochaeta isovalerica TaxID=150 RepID=A0A841R9S8_9SPIO|nr:Gfo/Idh/MocA family oxidoreductase [Spirochaeta isovalerica]MBB6480653.1 putative dehydrogenase [Spirochaeta isovalerica]